MDNERIYEWDVAREGDEAPPFVFDVTAEKISDYCKAVRFQNSIYVNDDAARKAGFPGIVAPPTMCYTYAPQCRVDLVARRGYVAPEQSAHAPRSTPFVASEITFPGRPVRPGDVITSTTRIRSKWERKGNRFITFAIAARNQRDELVADYTYVCIWEYAKGRNVREASATASAAPRPDVAVKPRRRTLDARTITFDGIGIGDALPIVEKAETQETIDQYRVLAIPGERKNWKDLHSDEGYAARGIFGGTVNMGIATVAYVAEVLERAFPLSAVLASGARLSMQAREPFRAGDAASFTGTVVGKHEDAGQRLVDVELEGINRDGKTIAKGTATVVL